MQIAIVSIPNSRLKETKRFGINHEGDYLSVFDPSYGVYVSTKQEFFSIWDKDHKGDYALLIAPKTENFKGYTPQFPNKRAFE